MYFKLNPKEFQMLEKTSDITGTDYALIGEFVPVENLVSMIEDLLLEIDRLEEKYSDLETEIEENYDLKKVDLYSEYGVRREDF